MVRTVADTERSLDRQLGIKLLPPEYASETVPSSPPPGHQDEATDQGGTGNCSPENIEHSFDPFHSASSSSLDRTVNASMVVEGHGNRGSAYCVRSSTSP